MNDKRLALCTLTHFYELNGRPTWKEEVAEGLTLNGLMEQDVVDSNMFKQKPKTKGKPRMKSRL